MSIFKNIKVNLDDELENVLKKQEIEFKSYRILRKSLDARKKANIHFVYEIETFDTPEPPPVIIETPPVIKKEKLPMTTVIGAGPAGLFAALRLIERGLPCRLIERGKNIIDRMRDISKHWKTGEVHPDSNVCFGEGGAGTFSDGKLITRIKSPHIKYVMDRFIKFGAPEQIRYLANPHVGSNKIRKIINSLTLWLTQNGCEVHFETPVDKFIFEGDKLNAVVDRNGKTWESDYWVLATGHSAHDIYKELFRNNVPCEAKSMAMGFRIEHPQEWVSKTQFGSRWEHEDLPVANYKLTCHNKNTGIGVYSFCMCPGGYVLPSSAQQDLMVVNGMSNYNHGSPFANSGIVVTVDKDKWYPGGAADALAFQGRIEAAAMKTALDKGKKAHVPVQTVRDYLKGRTGDVIKSSCTSGIVPVDLNSIYPKEINEAFKKALKNFDNKMPGFCSSNAMLHAVESRTSSPVRILRDREKLNSPAFVNFFSCR